MELFFSVQYRKLQGRKHKSWEDDGFLTVQDGKATLKDSGAQFIGTSSIAAVPEVDTELTVSSHDVLIEEALSVEEYSKRTGGSVRGVSTQLASLPSSSASIRGSSAAPSSSSAIPCRPSLPARPLAGATRPSTSTHLAARRGGAVFKPFRIPMLHAKSPNVPSSSSSTAAVVHGSSKLGSATGAHQRSIPPTSVHQPTPSTSVPAPSQARQPAGATLAPRQKQSEPPAARRVGSSIVDSHDDEDEAEEAPQPVASTSKASTAPPPPLALPVRRESKDVGVLTSPPRSSSSSSGSSRSRPRSHTDRRHRHRHRESSICEEEDAEDKAEATRAVRSHSPKSSPRQRQSQASPTLSLSSVRSPPQPQAPARSQSQVPLVSSSPPLPLSHVKPASQVSSSGGGGSGSITDDDDDEDEKREEKAESDDESLHGQEQGERESPERSDQDMSEREDDDDDGGDEQETTMTAIALDSDARSTPALSDDGAGDDGAKGKARVSEDEYDDLEDPFQELSGAEVARFMDIESVFTASATADKGKSASATTSTSKKSEGKRVQVSDDDDDEGEVQFVGQRRPAKVARLSGGSAVAPSSSSSIQTRCFQCLWRNSTQRKNAPWSNDGVLKVIGGVAVLLDKANGKEIARRKAQSVNLGEGAEFSCGNSDLQLVGELDAGDVEAVLAGSYFGSNAPSHASVSANKWPQMRRFAMPPLASASGSRDNMPRVSLGATSAAKSRFEVKADSIVMQRPTRLQMQEARCKLDDPVDVVVDPLLAGKLRPHQIEGVKFLYSCVMNFHGKGHGAVLADEMGLGKSIQAITLVYTLLKQNPYGGGIHGPGVIRKACIVCPASLVDNWKGEFTKWLGRDRVRVMAMRKTSDIRTFASSNTYEILIANYEKLTQVIDTAASANIGLLICDEGHRLKNPKTKTGVALRQLVTPRKVVLTGTPIQNDLGEFFTIVDFVNPGVFGSPMNFKSVYERKILKGRSPQASKGDRKLGKERQEELYRIVNTFMIRRNATINAKFLPPRYDCVIFCTPTARQVSIYRRVIRSDTAREFLNGDITGGGIGLVMMNMMRKVCNSPGLLSIREKGESNEIADDVRRLVPQGKDAFSMDLSGKLMVLSSLLEGLRAQTNEKVIVVSNFTSTLDLVEQHCKSKSYRYCRLDGSTLQQSRQEIIDTFNRTPPEAKFVFLLSSKSGGTGFNLIGASRLILFDPDWNPANDAQVMARIHREGQKRDCYVYRLLTTGTLDEKIYQRQLTKVALSTAIMENDAAAMGVSRNKRDAFTREELHQIYSIRPNILCETHELIGCRCGGAGEQPEGDDEESDDEDDTHAHGFAQASQMVANADEKEQQNRKRIAQVLRDWKHFDCTAPSVVHTIPDELLRGAIWERQRHAPEDDIRGSQATPEPPSDIDDDDEDDDDARSDAARMVVRSERKMLGGTVSYAFFRRAAVGAEATDEAELDYSSDF